MTAGLSPPVLLIIALGCVVGAGLALLVSGLTPREEGPSAAPSSGPDLDRLRAWGQGRLPYALGVGLLCLVATRWVVLSVGAALLVLFWDQLFGGARAEARAMARVQGLAMWTESLRDTIAGAVGLEQAIPSTAAAASPAIRRELTALSDRLRVRMPLPQALQRFADDLDDASADLIVAALILNARLRGPGLRQVLTSLSKSARAELEMRQRITAGRASTRRSVQIVVLVTLVFVVGLRLLNPSYVEPYGTPAGQAVLLVIAGLFALGFLWLRRLAAFDMPERFLTGPSSRRAVTRDPSPRALPVADASSARAAG